MQIQSAMRVTGEVCVLRRFPFNIEKLHQLEQPKRLFFQLIKAQNPNAPDSS
jgi:hypothetical protein